MTLPAHYLIDGVCAACRRALKADSARYRVGDNEYHADCFDISLFAPDSRRAPAANDVLDGHAGAP
jgi:hypothetical protein